MPNFEKKFGWSEVIALVALLFSIGASLLSWKAHNETRFLNELNFRPTISFRTEFDEFSSKSPHFTITNVGPVDAIKLQVQVTVLKYIPKLKKIMMASPISNPDWFIRRLSPLKPETIEFNNLVFDSVLPEVNESPTNRVLEVQITYHRDVDLKKYAEYFFYFKTLKGKWVDENDSALEPIIYNPIKNAVHQRHNIKGYMPSNPLR